MHGRTCSLARTTYNVSSSLLLQVFVSKYRNDPAVVHVVYNHPNHPIVNR